MESNNIPQNRVAAKSVPSLSSNPSIAPSPASMPVQEPSRAPTAPLTTQTAGTPGKPPKLYARLHMTSSLAPQMINEPSKKNVTPRLSGKRQMMGWAIGFLIAVVVALSVVVKLVQDDVKNEKKDSMAVLEAVEKEKAILHTTIAELEKQVTEGAVQQKDQHQALEQLKENMAQEKRVRTEVETKLVKSVKLQEVAQNEIADLRCKIEDMKGQLAIREQWARVLQDELSQEQETLKESEAKAGNQAKIQAEDQTQRVVEDPSARIQGGIENEQKALSEIRDTIAQKEKACGENEKRIVESKQQLKGFEKNTRSGAAKEDDLSRLQSRLANVKKQRAEAEERLKESERSLRESENAIAGLTNMIAAARMQEGNNRETAKAIAPLKGELEQETAFMNEVTARVDKQIRNLKALEDEKRRLNESLVLVKEKLNKEGQVTSKLDEIRLQIAGQKKIRTDMEAKLEQTTRDQLALEKETKELNQGLIDAGNIILNNENNFKATERFADKLRNEKEITRKFADLLGEKEQNVKRLGEEKEALQIKLNEAEASLAQQKERIKELDAKRRALNEEKKNRIVSDKKYAELVQAEKKHKTQIKESENKANATDKESKRLSWQVDKASSEIEAGQTAATGGSEVKETQNAQTAAGSSGKDTMAVEQAVLNQARTGDSHPEQQPGKKASKQPKSRSKQNKIAEAEEYYTLGIQKWDENDLDGAIEEFKKTVSLNPDAAGAYYNLSLAFLRQGKKEEACDYAYKAGECYIRIKNLTQAARMTVLLTQIDQNSPFIPKLRNKIAAVKNKH